ncbi:MAG: riboflavin synthase, partial [Phycisphaerales bacterium]|nr:riboflavin synthase [Phycisphaerales bacterium]
MFTGIIQHLGTVHAVEPRPWGRRLLIDAPDWAHTPRTGDSIAVNGVCL